MTQALPFLANGDSLSLDDVPALEQYEFRSAILEMLAGASQLAAYFAMPDGGDFRLFAVLTVPEEGGLTTVSCRAPGGKFPSLTPECPEAHLFEREMAEQYGLIPEGHPWLKPVRFHAPFAGKPPAALPDSFKAGTEPSVMEYFRTTGEEVHEVAVGPVHAGVIEPGHFRFQCHGERVFHLEISLGYQHRGIEQALIGGPDRTTIHLMETLAGDTSIGHATAYAMNVEALAGTRDGMAPEALRLRAVALELERLANHVGDIGALAGDVAFLPTASFCGRLRGDFLNMTALLCGNRFGRGLVLPGGTGVRLDAAGAKDLLARLETAMTDVSGALGLFWRTPSVIARFEDIGVLERHDAGLLGVVGPAARACGLERDARLLAPAGVYRSDLFPISLAKRGDILARAAVRRDETRTSADLVRGWIGEGCDPQPAARETAPALAPSRLSAALVEGWRGQICHVAITDAAGRFARYKVVDPSFKNWMGLAMAMRGQQVSDFPLCNKSFNLSYCGHDL